MRAWELNCAWGDDQTVEVLKCGGLHLAVSEVVPVGRGADKEELLHWSVFSMRHLKASGLQVVLHCTVLKFRWPNLSFVC